MLDDTRDAAKHQPQARTAAPQGCVPARVAVFPPIGLPPRQPQLGPAPERFDRTAGRLPQERQDLHRQGAAPQATDELAVVSHQDEAPTGVSDDLLSEERPTPALDAIDGRVDLVSAVDRQVEPAVYAVRDWDASRLGQPTGLHRRHHGLHLEALSYPPSQRVDA